MKGKLIIYQIIPRLFGSRPRLKEINGSLSANGCGKFSDLNHQALTQIKDLGVNHIWLTGLIRHASQEGYPEIGIAPSHTAICKGKAGSPYAIRDYYDIHPDLAEVPDNRFDEFESLLNRLKIHQLGLFIDFVPNHVSRDYKSLQIANPDDDLGYGDNPSQFFTPDNNFYYLPDEELQLIDNLGTVYSENPARATGNDVFHAHPGPHDWYETIKLNYGINPHDQRKYFDPIPSTWDKMLSILLYWAEKGIHGFRCDMAGMVPVEFWNFAIREVKKTFPDILFVAEIYEPLLYRQFIEAGFDYLYDKVGLYDSLRGIIENKRGTQSISQVWQSLDGLDAHMLRFMENHDEQRIASAQFAGDPWPGLPAMAVSLMMNKGPGLIYFGQELGESAQGPTGFSGDDGRTSIFDYTHIPSIKSWTGFGDFKPSNLNSTQLKLREAYQKLIRFSSKKLFHTGEFYDLNWCNSDFHPEQKLYAFIRHQGTENYLIVVSFNPELSSCTIRVHENALTLLGFADQDRLLLTPYGAPDRAKRYLISQICTSGFSIEIGPSGWSAYMISIN